MKKILMTLAAAAVAAGAWAQTDITPANYKISNPDVKLPFYQIEESEKPPLLNNINVAGAPVWSNIDGEKQWNNGLILIGSGGGMTYAQWQDFMNSWNYIDFGGEIGRTACFITKDCNIVEELKELAPNRADEFDALHQITNQYGGGAINFFLDPNNTPTTGFIRMKFVVNIYNNTFNGDQFIQNFNPVGDQNNAQSKWGEDTQVQNPMPDSGLKNNVCKDQTTGKWDPTKWVSVEVDFTVPEEAEGISYVPYRIKMFFQGSQATKESAMFFKEISFTHYETGDPQYLHAANIEYLTLNEDLANVESGETNPPTTNPVDLYIIGANVDGLDWDNGLGKTPMTYADGVYTWTGETLGSGFKINDGTWENDNYNIGAEEGQTLTLDTPFQVFIDEHSNDITFADYISVTNPKVVYDPEKGTVTVTGTGVEAPKNPDLYVIGANVDGEEWALGTNQMTYADGVYTWTGKYLGNEFKINDGTWGATFNIGAKEGELTLDKAFDVVAAGNSANIEFADYVGVNNPKVVFDLEAMTVTVTGEGVEATEPEPGPGEEDTKLYVMGAMNNWAATDEMTQDPDNEDVYVYAFKSVAADEAEFKIGDATWKVYDFGAATDEDGKVEVYSDKPAELTLVEGGKNIVITNWATGPMIISFNLETKELVVEGSNQTSGVSKIETENAEVEYYNLQGVKVANPDKGIYIIRKGNTTSKAVIR